MKPTIVDELIRTLPRAGSGAVHNRRSFLVRALLGGTAAAALSSVIPTARAQAATGDLDVLAVALSLERLGVAFYEEQLPKFNARAFRSFNRFNSAVSALRRQAGNTGDGAFNFPPGTPGDVSGGNGTSTTGTATPLPPRRGRNGAGGTGTIDPPGTTGTNTTGSATNVTGTATGTGTGTNTGRGRGTGRGTGGNRNTPAAEGAVDVRSLLARIRDNEAAHLSQIEQAYTSRGGTLPDPATYNFDVNNLAGFLRLAQQLENVDAQFYDGALGLLSDRALIEQAASIGKVEARQAAFLNLLHGQVPFPQSFEPALSPQAASTFASQFIT